MYTGIRIKVTVKEKYRSMVRDINDGEEWLAFAEQFPFLRDYAKQSRAEFIPGGALCYMPNDWEIGESPMQSAADGFDRSFDMATGKWAFQCSLKNYNEEIEQFFREVLPELISEAAHIEYYYEEWDSSHLYAFVDGELKQTTESVVYRDDQELPFWGALNK